jgi:hypothetical protein
MQRDFAFDLLPLVWGRAKDGAPTGFYLMGTEGGHIVSAIQGEGNFFWLADVPEGVYDLCYRDHAGLPILVRTDLIIETNGPDLDLGEVALPVLGELRLRVERAPASLQQWHFNLISADASKPHLAMSTSYYGRDTVLVDQVSPGQYLLFAWLSDQAYETGPGWLLVEIEPGQATMVPLAFQPVTHLEVNATRPFARVILERDGPRVEFEAGLPNPYEPGSPAFARFHGGSALAKNLPAGPWTLLVADRNGQWIRENIVLEPGRRVVVEPRFK